MKKFVGLLLFFCCASMLCKAQNAQKPVATKMPQPTPATLVHIDYGLVLPVADLGNRFGLSSKVGGSVMRKTANNLLFGVDGFFLFGNVLKEDSLAINLFNSDGYITGTDGLPADVSLFLRGFLTTFKAGKLFTLNAKNPNSGIFVLGGAGFLQHKLHIVDRNESVPQLQGKYRYGYDRLTNGFALQQNIGYQYLANNRLVNFRISAEAVQAFTQNRRSYNFDTRRAETGRRIDVYFGISIGWILPLYPHSDDQFFIN